MSLDQQSSQGGTIRKELCRVLLIEDDMFDCQVIKRYLRGASHISLEHVETLSEAVELVRDEPFDCALLDWYLPDGEGAQFLEYVSDTAPWLPTLVMTSGMHNKLTTQALALGAQDYIRKGEFSADELKRAIELAIARKRAERERWSRLQQERLSFVNQVVAGVAHEINNPVAWIGSNIGLLHMQFEQGDVDTKEAIELCQECTEGIARITSVVRVLRSYAESIDKTLEMADLGLVVQQCIKDVQEHKEWGVDVSFTSVSSMPHPYMDRVAVRKALFQIILNAFQAAAQSRTLERRVNIELSLHDRRLVVDVHDSGQGMDAVLAERVFEPFYSSQRATNLGMGLAIAHEVIISHRGTIEVKKTSPLGGAWIQVRLPVI